MKNKNYITPSVSIDRIDAESAMLTVSMATGTGKPGDAADSKHRIDKPMSHEANDIEYGNLW